MNLQDFLNANQVDNITKEVIVSERFKDENGNILKFKIKPITHKDFGVLRNKHTSYSKKGNIVVDSLALTIDLITDCTIIPNFKDVKSLKAVDAVTSEQYINKVLLAGEINALEQAIMDLSGFKSFKDLTEDVKN